MTPAQKRRKLDKAPPQSAFALRQHLQSQQTRSSDETPSVADQGDDQSPAASLMNWADEGSDTETPAGANTDAAVEPRKTKIDFVFPSKNQLLWSENGLEIILKDGENLKFPTVGSYRLAVSTGSGQASIAGMSLSHGSELVVHAPLCHSIPILRCSDSVRLRLSPQPCPRRLEHLAPSFRRIWPEPESGRPAYRSQDGAFQIGLPSENSPKNAQLQPLVVPAEWNKHIAQINEQRTRSKRSTSTLVCGPKSSGKSTFSRILGNMFVSTSDSVTRKQAGAVLLDLDPGQPEFAPAGVLSLVLLRKPNLSPPFAHPWADGDSATLLRCHAMAATSPADNVQLFTGMAKNLHGLYISQYAHLPLIINTPGWILGGGLDLLSTLISTLYPTNVVYMSLNGPEDTVEGLRSACEEIKRELALLPSRPQGGGTSRTSAQLREMHTMSYFHYKRGPESWGWDEKPLAQTRPYHVAYQGSKRGILGVVCYDTVALGHIDGRVLALVEIEDKRAFPSLAADCKKAGMHLDEEEHVDGYSDADHLITFPWRTLEGIPFASGDDKTSLDPIFSQMIGLVLVKGIDETNKTLHLLSPIPPDVLNKVRSQGRQLVLVQGRFDTPGWFYVEEAHANNAEEEEDNSDDEDCGPLSYSAEDRLPWIEVLRPGESMPVGSQLRSGRRDTGKAGRKK